MRGSGLSLERFIKGKAHKTKGEAKSKKKAIIHKAQRRREYEKVKKREQGANAGNGDDGDKNDAGGPTSFYDRFFRDLKSGKLDDKDDEDDEDDADDSEAEEAVKPSPQSARAHTAKPNPFFKAQKKADTAKQEKQRKRDERQRRQAEVDAKVKQRKKRHVKLSVRTATGQPVVRNHIGDILSKLQAEQRRK